LAAIYPFDRFSELSKKVLTHAQTEAERANHSYIGTEHLLLGLLGEPEGLAAKALWGLGIYLDAVRVTIERVVGRDEPRKIVQIIPTSTVKRTIELAFDEAKKMHSDWVGTEHLLLGLMVEGTNVASHVLTDMGVEERMVRAEIERLRAGRVVEARGSEINRIFGIRSRVLVHDPQPPHRLWEGRITGHQADRFRVEITGHPGGEEFLVESERMHPIPLLSSRRCEFCQAS
jgi:ATP-dependent Clp protease ATP-binding subunit ClpA